MKWIKASERLPERGKAVIWKWSNISGVFIEYTDWTSDNRNTYIRGENLINIDDGNNQYYWLDEPPEDWEALEKKFNGDFSTLTDKPRIGYDIVQWFKENL